MRARTLGRPEKPPPRKRRSAGELALALGMGLLIGCAVATVALLGGRALLSRQPPTPLPFPTPSGTGGVTPPLPTPLPTIPVATIAAPPVAGGTISTTSGAIKFTLPGGSTIYVGPDSTVELTELPASPTAPQNTVLTLFDGRLLVLVDLRPGEAFFIQSPATDLAQVIGSVMGVEYDAQAGRFEVDCLEGHCRIGTLNEWIDLTGGQHSVQQSNGSPQPPDNSRNDLWRALGGDDVPPGPMPDLAATQAAFCATLQAQFPGTPCP